MNITWLELTFLALAHFRLTRLLVFDRITEFIRRPFIEEVEEEEDGEVVTYIKFKGNGLRRWIGELLSCYWCTGVWCAFFLYGAWVYWPVGTEPLVIILAIAAIGAIIESVIQKLIE
ncbi:DUF1360 domain-containing protein [Bacillus timonensis]|nr:DUF1360 domain-containing protein [Bacillus timonensis]